MSTVITTGKKTQLGQVVARLKEQLSSVDLLPHSGKCVKELERKQACARLYSCEFTNS